MSLSPEIFRVVDEAERAVRRGNLDEALRLYGEASMAAPDDPAILARAEDLQNLFDHDVSTLSLPADLDELPPTPEQRAEALFEAGDLRGALLAYGDILLSRPNHALAFERFQELRHLAEHRLKSDPRALSPAQARPIGGDAPAEDFDSLFEAAQLTACATDAMAKSASPEDPLAFLKSLLGRIAERRRDAIPAPR